MRPAPFCAILMAAILTSFSAAAQCERPTEPIIPNGKSATKADIRSAFQAVKQYQTDLGTFRDCLDREQLAYGDALPRDIFQVIRQRYDASVDSEEAVAAEFNIQYRAYKETNPE